MSHASLDASCRLANASAGRKRYCAVIVACAKKKIVLKQKWIQFLEQDILVNIDCQCICNV